MSTASESELFVECWYLGEGRLEDEDAGEPTGAATLDIAFADLRIEDEDVEVEGGEGCNVSASEVGEEGGEPVGRKCSTKRPMVGDFGVAIAMGVGGVWYRDRLFY